MVNLICTSNDHLTAPRLGHSGLGLRADECSVSQRKEWLCCCSSDRLTHSVPERIQRVWLISEQNTLISFTQLSPHSSLAEGRVKASLWKQLLREGALSKEGERKGLVTGWGGGMARCNQVLSCTDSSALVYRRLSFPWQSSPSPHPSLLMFCFTFPLYFSPSVTLLSPSLPPRHHSHSSYQQQVIRDPLRCRCSRFLLLQIHLSIHFFFIIVHFCLFTQAWGE